MISLQLREIQQMQDASLPPELLSSVGSFALYVNDNRETLPRSGTLLIDSVKLTGEREPYTPEKSTEENEEVKPLLLDDFSSYSDTDALRSHGVIVSTLKFST